MLKKGLMMLTLFAVMAPMMAFSYTLTTRINNSAGQIVVNGGTPQTTLGAKFTFVPNGTAATVVITPAANYTIARIQQGGTYIAVPGDGTITIPNTQTKALTINVWFAKQMVSVTATAGTGGSVAPAGTKNYQAGRVVNYKFTPALGNSVISISGIPAGATVTPSLPAAADTPVIVTFPATSATMNGVFQSVIANAGAPQTVMVGSSVTLDASASVGATTWQWTQTAGPTVTLTGATTNKASFTASSAGSYTFKLTTTDGGSNTSTAYTSVQATSSIASSARTQCANCHISLGVDDPAIYTNWSSSMHGKSTHSICSACHYGTNIGGHPGTVNADSVDPAAFTTNVANVNGTLAQGAIFCTYCHVNSGPYAIAIPHVANLNRTCNQCHTAAGGIGVGGTGDAHQVQELSCIKCHSVAQSQAAPTLVNDNNGVRAITTEFTKWSHHVDTSVTLNDAHCAACHLEGKASAYGVSIDSTKHMVDGFVHLRNADTDADMMWNPEAPNFSAMDTFCMSCHDSNGATSAQSALIQAYLNNNGIAAPGKTASATNPFGDSITNQYDKMERPAVVDAAGQFSTSNPSHHAVRGKRYTGRTRTSGDPRAVDESSLAFNRNSSATLPGNRSTIFDAGKFDATYTTLANADGSEVTLGRNGGSKLGDDSTLHCGDCHTVGQFAARGSVAYNNMSAAGIVNSRYYKTAIGAHGSNNEYLLRNNIGSDERHQGVETTGGTSGVPSTGYGTKPYLVCFNCHAFATYGSVGGATNIGGLNHVGEYANTTRCNGPYNTIFGNMTGDARLRSTVTQSDSASYGKQSGSTTYGNAFGIQCANCHSSGYSAGNIFGGIHGAKDATYTDGMGNTTKHYRFLPGLGNVMYVPGTKGGFYKDAAMTQPVGDAATDPGFYAAYNVYSGNRNGTGTGNTVGQSFTTLPYRTIVPGNTAANVTTVDGKPAPSTPAYSTTPAGPTTGSYQYVSGGYSSDLNWEQKSPQAVAGQYDFQAQPMGCYTLSPAGTVVYTGQNGDPNKVAASDSIAAAANGPNGTPSMFDNWGGCDDHNDRQGTARHKQFRKVVRPTTY